MFLRRCIRRKSGKRHTYWALVGLFGLVGLKGWSTASLAPRSHLIQAKTADHILALAQGGENV